MSGGCSSCGGVATVGGCGCSGSGPMPIKACLPGVHQPVTWAAWQAGCWPKGMIFRVTDGPCPGLYVGSGDTGVAADRIMMRVNFSTANGFKFVNDGCDVAVDWSDIPWDDIPWDDACGAAETLTPADADFILFCHNGALKKSTFENFFANVCYDLPAMDESACDLELVAFVKDAQGCGKLVRYSAEDSLLDRGRFYDVQRDRGVAAPASPTGYIWPDDFIANPYDYSELQAELGFISDAHVPTNQANEARLEKHVAAVVRFTLTCPTKLEGGWRWGVRNELDLKEAVVIYRWREVGQTAWLYSESYNLLSSPQTHNAVTAEVEKTGLTLPTLAAGSWEMQLLVLPKDAANPVKYNFTDGSTSLPTFTVRKRIG